MRILPAATVLTLLLTGSVYAAPPGAPAAPQDPPKSPGQLEQEKAQDRAYKNSLGNIPDKPPADPWGGARAVDGTSSTTTSSSTTSTKRSKSN
jgi:hypothetical protein